MVGRVSNWGHRWKESSHWIHQTKEGQGSEGFGVELLFSKFLPLVGLGKASLRLCS